MPIGIAMVVLAAGTWGTWSLFLRPTHLSTTITSPIVFLVMGVSGLPLALREVRRGTWDRKTWALLVAHGALDAINVLAFFGAMANTTVAVAVLTHYLAPVIIAVGAPFLDRPTPGDPDGRSAPDATVPALVALAGLVIILEPWRAPEAGAVVGAILGGTSACCYAGNVFVLRRLIPRIGSAGAMSFHSLIAAAMMVPIALLAGGLGTGTGSDLGLLVAGGLVPGAAAGLLFNAGLGKIGSARTAVLTFAEPLVAVVLGVLVWGESLHPLAAVGGALVLGSGIHVARKAR